MAASTSFSNPAMLAVNAAGKPCRCCKYSGVLKDTQQRFAASCHASTLSGRSNAVPGAATISGVPAAGLPRINSCDGGILRPAAAASLAKLMRANTVKPRCFARLSRRSRVASTPLDAAHTFMPLSDSLALTATPYVTVGPASVMLYDCTLNTKQKFGARYRIG